tara:strand:+ start:896 stop:1291 length:396 start_codon:yes stop_codon:yes gene_type:complete
MSLEIFKEAWEKATTCQQCQSKLSAKEMRLGRICDDCVKKNKGKVWGKDSDDNYTESTRPSFSSFVRENALTDDGKPIVQEVPPPGMESWIKANKAKFLKLHGTEKGLSALHSAAWDEHNKKKSAEGSRMD